ncbi:glycosyltransferase family 4 protein [Candidatus Woesearchaeota archaeon]|nr:glycosyltransferase family 4 protein [Candidatus Woesearchaeota archaeon]
MKNTIILGIERFPPDFTGSGLRAYRQSLRIQSKYGYKFIILTNKSKQKEITKDLEIIRIPTITPKILLPIYLIELFIRINLIMQKRKDDISLIHMFSLYWLNRMLMLSNILFYKKPSILEVTLDGDDDPVSLIKNSPLGKIISNPLKALMKKIGLFIVQTKNSKRSCEQIGISQKKIWQRPNPIDEKVFGKIPFSKIECIKKRLTLPKGINLVNIGAISKRKNQLLLAKVLKQVQYQDVNLLLIGPKSDKKYYNIIQKQIKESKLENRIVFMGEKTNTQEYLLAADIFVFSSEREGFGNVFGEAMISGLPIITTYLDGISKFININNGIIITEKNEEDKIRRFASEIDKIIRKKTTYNRQIIRNMGIKYFSAKNIDLQYHEKYNRLIK